MITNFLTALCLLLVLEGLLPLIAPKVWRENFKRVLALKDGQLRFMGLVSIMSGIIIFWILK